MKTVFAFLFLLVISGYGIAQSKENYRSRNHKLNRNYQKNINSKKHQVAVYKSGKANPDQSLLKANHQAVKSVNSKKLEMKLDNRKKREEGRSDYRSQKSTLQRANKKSGKKLLSYVTMVMAFSLFLVNK